MKRMITLVVLLLSSNSVISGVKEDYLNFIDTLAYCMNVQMLLWGSATMSISGVEKDSEAHASLKKTIELSNPYPIKELFDNLVPDEEERDRLFSGHTESVGNLSMQTLIIENKECYLISYRLKK